MKYSLLILMAGVFLSLLLPLCFAQVESFGTKRQNSEVNLIQTYNASYCNITSITSPNSTLYSQDVEMTKTGLRFNYTFASTSELGGYIVCGECDTKGWCANLEITPKGTQLSSAQGIIYFVFLVAGIGLFLLCLFYAVKIQWKNERDEEGYVIGVNELKYLKLFLIVACYLILMFLSGLLRSITANYIPELGVSGFFEWVFWIMLSLMYPIIVCSLIFAFIIFLSNKKFTKALERGLPIQ